MASANQLFATVGDLNEMGPPIEALSTKTYREKVRALRAASAMIASYVRGRYKLPLVVIIEELDLSSIQASQITLQGVPEEALSLTIRFDSAGTAGATPIPISWSYDGGATYDNTGTLPATGVFTVSSAFSILVQGPVTQNATVAVNAGVDWAIRQHTVNIAAYNLVYNRGVDPDTEPGKNLVKRYDDAMKWALHLQDEKAKLEEGSDSTPTKKETGPRGTGQSNSWDWLC